MDKSFIKLRPYASNKMDFTRGNLSPNLQARFCQALYYRNYWKNLRLSRNSDGLERKRLDREGVLWKIVVERRARTKYIALILLL